MELPSPSFWRMKQKPECILQVWCPKSGILLGSPSLDLSQLMPLIDMLTLILTQSQTKFFYDGCMDTKLTSLGWWVQLYTETPNDTRILPPDTIPQLLPQSTIPPLYKDQDSVSTFCSRASLTSRHTEGNATEETNDLDTLAGSDTTESTTNTSLRKRRPPSPIPPQTAEISVDSTATTQQVSGLSEDNTRIGHLELNMHEIN